MSNILILLVLYCNRSDLFQCITILLDMYNTITCLLICGLYDFFYSPWDCLWHFHSCYSFMKWRPYWTGRRIKEFWNWDRIEAVVSSFHRSKVNFSLYSCDCAFNLPEMWGTEASGQEHTLCNVTRNVWVRASFTKNGFCMGSWGRRLLCGELLGKKGVRKGGINKGMRNTTSMFKPLLLSDGI